MIAWSSSEGRGLGIALNAVVALALLLIVGGTYREIDRIRASQLQAAGLEAKLQAQAFAEHADAIVRTVDFALVELASQWTGWAAFHEKAARISGRLGDLAVQVSGTDAQGIVMSTNLAAPSERVSVADREHIRVHLEDRVQGLYISDPIFGRVSRKWSIQFTRAVRAQGRVVAVLVISVAPAFFSDFYQRLSNQRPGDVISMLKPDGIILARAPDPRESMGVRLASVPDFAADPAGSGYYTRTSAVDGVERIYGWYRARSSGLVLVSGIDRRLALASFQRERLWLIFSAVLGSVVLLGLAIVVNALARKSRRDAHRAREEYRRLEAAVSARTAELQGVIADLSASQTELQVARSALDSASEGVTIADARDPEYPVVYVNEAFERITGYTRGEVIGRSVRFLHASEPEQAGLDTVRSALRHQRHCRVLLRNFRKGGELFHNELSLAPLRDTDGEVTHYVGIQTDVTHRVAIEAQLRDSQKMEAIGQLTGGLAHDFNNLLGVVIGNLDLIGEKLPADEPLRRSYRAALDAALQGASVTRSLLAVARRQPLQVGVDDLNALVSEMLPLVRSSAGTGVTVRLQLAAGELPVLMDAGGLSNAVLNLVINARDAMKTQSGEHLMVVRTRRQTLVEDPDRRLAAGDYAVVDVEDNGPGMSDEVRARAFELFFTTKSAGHGTGLGLSMVRGFAEQLNGAVWLDSAPGRGTTVSLLLPLAAAATGALYTEPVEPELAELAGEPASDPASLTLAALARDASRACVVPASVLVLTDGHHLRYLAGEGFAAERLRELRALCARAALRAGDLFVVEDTMRDETLAETVTPPAATPIRFFAAARLATDEGRTRGLLCVLDSIPHALSPLQENRLRELAGRAVTMMGATRDLSGLAPASASKDDIGAAALAPPGTRQRVLVVDDERALCELGCAWLQSMGFDAIGVDSPSDALRVLNAEAIDILFTDVVMPGGMDGFELAREARRLQPKLRVLLASGYARGLMQQTDLPGPLLNKPYRKHDLQRIIEALR